jgi:hypothetical protein
MGRAFLADGSVLDSASIVRITSVVDALRDV